MRAGLALPSTVLAASRAQGLGGSEVAAAMGRSPFQTPHGLWRLKRGLEPESPPSDPMVWGTYMESGVAQWYEATTGARCMPGPKYDHPIVGAEPWILLTPDLFRLCPDGRLRIVEIKSPGDPVDTVPEHYLYQGAWYAAGMESLGYDVDDVVDYAFGVSSRRQFQLLTESRDRDLEVSIVDFCRWWWHHHVVDGHEPDPTDGADLLWCHPRVRAPVRPAMPDEEPLLEELAEVLRAEAALAARRDDLTVKIKARIANAGGLHGRAGRVLWSETRGAERLDTRALREAHPDIAERFTQTGAPGRQFRPEFPGLGGRS